MTKIFCAQFNWRLPRPLLPVTPNSSGMFVALWTTCLAPFVGYLKAILRVILALLLIAVACSPGVAQAAIVYISQSSASNNALPTNGSAGALTINKPAGTIAGHALIASIAARPRNMTVTVPAGWIQMTSTQQTAGGVSTQPGGMTLLTFYKIATLAEPASYSWTFANPTTGEGGSAVGGILAFSGIDTSTSPIDVWSFRLTPNGLTHQTNSITPTVTNTMIVSSISYLSASSFANPTGIAGLVERLDQSAPLTANAIGTTLQMATAPWATATATGASQATAATVADTGVGHLMALKPADIDSAIAMARGGPLNPGASASYTLTVTNNGLKPEPGSISVVNTLPAGLSYASFSGAGWACVATGQVVTCTRAGALAGGASTAPLVLNVNVNVGASGTLTNTATVSGTGGDGNTANNTATDSYTIPLSTYAYYKMDEASWTGAANEVLDGSGNNRHATALGGIATVAAPALGLKSDTCRGANVPDNNALPTIEAVNTAIDINDLGNAGTINFWYRSRLAWDTGNGNNDDRTLLDATNNGGTGEFWLVLRENGSLRFRLDNNGGSSQVVTTNTYSIAAGAWTHLAISWNFTTGSMCIYVNGVADSQCQSNDNNITSTPNYATLYIGDNRGIFANSSNRGNSADGAIDEVRLYASELTLAQIAADMNATHACAVVAPHHLEVQHGNGTGLTCSASTLTIKACTDSAVPCVTPYTGGVSGTLSATGSAMTVNWDGTTGGATGSGFVIPVGGSVTKNVQVATAGTVTFGVATATPTPTNATTCNFGTNAPPNNNCVFTANTAGFIFSNTTTGNAYTIPPQVSGIATAANALYLRAVQASTTNPAVCTPAIISSTTAVNMGYACNNPATCQTGNLTTINTTPVASGGTPVNLTFDANGSTPIIARYDDVGRITLSANATVTPVFTGATPVVLNGSSNAFVVAPHHFGISGVTAAPLKAGNNFSAIVTAYNGLVTSTATRNFGLETMPEGVTMSFAKCQPTGVGSANGAFSASLPAFAGGTATAANFNWSEVGNGDLVATLASGNYLGSGLTALGNTGTGGTVCSTGAGNVGRFIPDHFDTAFIDGCFGCGFTYSGQRFTVSLTAKNGLATPTTTVNYDGTSSTAPNFAKAVTLSAWDAVTGLTQNPGGSLLPPASTAVASTVFFQGVASLNTAATMPFYTFTTVETLPTLIRVRAVDTDNVTSLRVPLSSSTEGQPEIRSGRIKVFNVYGSELLQLPIAVTAQYWKDATAGWVTSSTDSSSSFVVATPPATSAVNFANYQKNLTAVSIAGSPKTVLLSSGVGGFTLSAPGFGNSGSVDMSIPGLAGASCYVAPTPLGCYLPSNTARATFGIYKSPLIYRRENY